MSVQMALGQVRAMRQEKRPRNMRTECSPSPFGYYSAMKLFGRFGIGYHVQCLLVKEWKWPRVWVLQE